MRCDNEGCGFSSDDVSEFVLGGNRTVCMSCAEKLTESAEIEQTERDIAAREAGQADPAGEGSPGSKVIDLEEEEENDSAVPPTAMKDVSDQEGVSMEVSAYEEPETEIEKR